MNSKKKYIIATAMMNALMPVCSMQAAAGHVNEAAAVDMQEDIKEAAAVQEGRNVLEIRAPQVVGVSEKEVAAAGHVNEAAAVDMQEDVKESAGIQNVLSPEEIESANQALFKAVERGELSAATAALNAGADVNARDKYGHIPLVGFNDVAMVDFLIKNGADVNARDAKGSTALIFLATFSSRFNVVSLLLRNGADVNAHDQDGKTALMNADDVATVELLINNGADVNARDKDGCTALMRFVKRPKIGVNIVSLLLRNGADVNARSADGKTPLLHYLRHLYNAPIDFAIVELLINAGADVNAQDKESSTPLRYTAFEVSREEGLVASNIATMQLLLRKGARVDVRDINGETPLMHVVSVFGYSPLVPVQLLIDNGADVNAQDKYGNTPLDNAARCLSYNEEVVRLLLKRATTATIEKTLGNIPARCSVIKQLLQEELASRNALNAKDAQRLLEEQKAQGMQEAQRLLEDKKTQRVQKANEAAAVDMQEDVKEAAGIQRVLSPKEVESANQALFKAVERGDVIAATAALKAGANINARDKLGSTVLIGCNDLTMAKFLIREGIDVNACDKYFGTALIVAANRDKVDVVSLLLRNGADVNAHDRIYGKTSLMCTDDMAIVKLLINKGADVNARDKDGCTALTRFVKCQKIDIVSLLLRNGADVNARDKNGKTPLVHYLSCHIDSIDSAVVELLINNGADVNVQDNEGNTPLRYIAFKVVKPKGKEVFAQNIATMKLLVSNGANVNMCNINGSSPLIVVVDDCGYCRSLAPIRLLLDNGADVNVQDKYGRIPLGSAVTSWSLDRELVQLLLKRSTRATIEKVLDNTSEQCWTDRSKIKQLSIKQLLQEELGLQKALEEIEAQRLLKEQETQRLLEEKDAQRVQEAQEDQRILEEGCKNFQAMIAYAAREDNQEMFKWLVARNPEQAAEEKCAVCLNTMPELVAAQTALCNVGEVCQHIICKPCKGNLEESESLTCPLCRAYSGSSADLSLSWGDTAQLLLRPAMWGYFKRSKQIQQIHRDSVAEFQAKFELFRPSYEYLKQQFNAQRQDEEVKEAAAQADSPFEFSIVVNK